MGEIRTTVEYLGELLETEAFKENTIDTAWLDGILAAKSVVVEVEPQSAVINAAVYRAYNQIQGAIAGFEEALSKGQLSTLALIFSLLLQCVTSIFLAQLADARGWRLRMLVIHVVLGAVCALALGLTPPDTPALLQALQPARAPPARPVSTRARATVMANSLTTISANNLKMTDNIKACGAPRPLDTARRPKPPPGGREGGREARRGEEPTPPRAGTSKRRSAASSRSTPACPRDATPT